MNEVDNQILNLEKFCNEQISKFNYTNFGKPIYHYTSLKNFINIIKSQTFYFTNYKNLNDPHEVKYGLEIIQNIINKNRLPYTDFLLEVINKTLADINYYICSFSKNPNNLSLWRLYADDGYGIVLGVSSHFPLEEDNPTENPHISTAIYDESVLKAFIIKLCKKVINVTKSHSFKTLNQNEQDEAIFSLCRRFSYALSLCLISKNKSFEHEDEVRLLLYDGDKSRLNTHPNGFYYPSNRFVLCKSERKYHELDEELNVIQQVTNNSKHSLPSARLKKEFLIEIWIGSKLNDNQTLKIKRLLLSEGYSLDNIKIDKIVLPYR